MRFILHILFETIIGVEYCYTVAFDLECTEMLEMTSKSTPEVPATNNDIPEIAKRRGSICLSMSFGQDAEWQPKNAKPAW